MKRLRETIIKRGPFSQFHIECCECGEDVFTTDDYKKDAHMRNEVLICHRIEEHVKQTGHKEIGGQIDPLHTVKTAEITVTVNETNK